MRRLALLLILLLSGWASAQGDGAVPLPAVRAASESLHNQVTSGQSEVVWTGLGLVSGEMVDMELTNNSGVPQTYRFLPGMVLQDPAQLVQPIVLEENLNFTLRPGESVKRRMRGYCLDYSKNPPAAGSNEDYQIDPDLGGYDRAVEVLYKGLTLDQERKLKPVLRPLVHRTLVIQRAVWAVLGGENPDSKEELQEDLEEEIRYRSTIFPEGQLDCLSQRIWSDVQKVLGEQ